jgi:signal transduction histidine kinase
MLGELIDILIDNACKYSAPGSPIRLSLRRDRDQVAIEIQDSGCGISDDDLPHVFTPFFRSADARRDGIAGLGLGLAIAQRLATALGGQLTATSRVGEGSRFQISLPASAAAKDNQPVSSPSVSA